MAALPDIQIDVFSDVVCPWCYIGQKRLASAVAQLDGIATDISWRPFQLDPTIPEGGLDRRAYMIGKFGSEDRIRQAHERITPLGAAEGISFDFKAIKVSPNTLDAHRLIRWAGGAGVQDAVVRALFSAYFEQGRNVGDHAVLIEVARQSGMDATLVETLLPTDADREAVAGEVATASRMGISGVPCFVLERRYAVSGAQDAEILANAVRQVAAAKARGELAAAG